ncbi:MAG: phage tail tube protein [Paenalcaligenes sp.]
MGQRIAGTVYVKVDGVQLTTTGAFSLPIGDVTRETLEPGYFSEKARVPYVKGDVLHTSDFPIDKITQGTDMTVTVELNNGRTYTLVGAYLVGESESNTEDGKVSLEFEGEKGVWSV